MRDTVTALSECARTLEAEEQVEVLDGIGRWLEQPAVHIVVCGEFKRGKSALTNALLGSDLCPTDVLPATAVPAIIQFGPEPSATVVRYDGTREPVVANRRGLQALCVDGEKLTDDVRHVEASLPSPLLERGVVLIDTPGVNDLSQHRAEVTHRYLPLADVVLFVLDSTAPVTKTEAAFLEDVVLPDTLDRVIFVLGKSDRLDEDELEESIEAAETRLTEILGRKVRIHPFSAVDVRQGETENLDELVTAIDGATEQAGSTRRSLATRRLRRIAAELGEEASARRTALVATEVELDTARLRFDSSRHELFQQLAAFEEYIDLYGRTTLRELITTSLASARKDLEEDLEHQLSLISGDVGVFLKVEVPHRVSRRLKNWSTAKGVEIDAFLHRLVERVAADYSRAFSTPLELAGLPQTLGGPEVTQRKEELTRNRTKELIAQKLLPTAVPMVAGFLLLGPLGLVAGGLLGQVAAVALDETRVESQRAAARQTLARQLAMAFEGFEAALLLEVDRWFDELRLLLRRRFSTKEKQVQRLLSPPREELEAPVAAVEDRLARITATLEREVSDE